MPQQWVSDVLGFWFGELGPDEWFSRSDATDAKIRERFLRLWGALSAHVPRDIAATSDGAVAAVLVHGRAGGCLRQGLRQRACRQHQCGQAGREPLRS